MSKVLSACEHPQTSKKDHPTFQLSDFKASKPLEGSVIKLANAVKPSKICVLPEFNLLIIADEDQNYLAKAYTLDSIKFIKSFIQKGGGSSQQLNAFHLSYDKKERQLLSSDPTKRNIYVYALDSIINPISSVVPMKIVTVQSPVLLAPHSLGTNKIADLRYNKKSLPIGVINFYNKSGELLSFNGNFPPIDESYEPEEFLTIFTGRLNLSQDKSRLILGYLYTDFIDIYDTTGHLISRVQGPDGIYPHFKTVSVGKYNSTNPTKESRLAYRQIINRNNDLFALYDGGKLVQRSFLCDVLFRFDMNLTPLTNYKLDKPIFDFDIDTKSGTLYGISNEIPGTIITFQPS